jgi:hypothetical protein
VGVRRLQRQRRARRPWERAGEVRSWRRGTVGVPWRAHAGRYRAERQKERRGGPGCFSTFFRVSRPGSGQGGCGVDRGELYAYGDEAREYGEAVTYSSLDFTEFRPPSVRSNARMKLNFENLNSATVGCQDTS